MADHALLVGPDDQVVPHRRQPEIGAQFGCPIPGAALRRRHFDQHQGIGDPGGVARQDRPAPQKRIGLEVAVLDLHRHAAAEGLAGCQSRLARGASQGIARRALAQIMGRPLRRHRDHDAVDPLEPADRLLRHPGEEFLPAHGSLGLVRPGVCHRGGLQDSQQHRGKAGQLHGPAVGWEAIRGGFDGSAAACHPDRQVSETSLPPRVRNSHVAVDVSGSRVMLEPVRPYWHRTKSRRPASKI